MDLLIGVKNGGSALKLEDVSYSTEELTHLFAQAQAASTPLLLKGEKRELIIPVAAVTFMELVESASRPVGFLGH